MMGVGCTSDNEWFPATELEFCSGQGHPEQRATLGKTTHGGESRPPYNGFGLETCVCERDSTDVRDLGRRSSATTDRIVGLFATS